MTNIHTLTQPPADFGDPRAEYAAARTSAALFDLSDRAEIELTGKDRAKFLHNFCTNDILGLSPGSGCEAFLTNVQGRVLAHVFVFAGDDALRLESVPGSAERIIAHLSRYQINEAVEFRDRTPERGPLFLTGPEAVAALSRAGIDASGLAPLQHASSNACGFAAHIRRNDLLGTPGFLLSATRDRLPNLWQKLSAAGAQPAGTAAFHSLRIEAGTPLYDQDITDANLAPEVGRNAQAINYKKGCYLGQEPIARIDALGHVNQELRRIRLEKVSGTFSVPAPGSEVVSPDADQRSIGHVTSSALSYSNDHAVALAYVRRNFNAPGSQVKIRVGNDAVAGIIF